MDTESMFTPIEDAIYRDTQEGETLSWMKCRENYLLKHIDEIKKDLNDQINARGTLFRETVDQFLLSPIKALRGKITWRNCGKMIEISFITPKNIWNYYLEPMMREIKNIEQEDEFALVQNNIILKFDITELHEIIALHYYFKFCSQFFAN